MSAEQQLELFSPRERRKPFKHGTGFISQRAHLFEPSIKNSFIKKKFLTKKFIENYEPS